MFTPNYFRIVITFAVIVVIERWASWRQRRSPRV